MGSTEKEKQYCIVIKEFKEGKRTVYKGMVGCCESETKDKVHIRILDPRTQRECFAEKANLKLISKREAEFFFSLSSLTKRCEWIQKEELLKSVCGLQENDIVQLSLNKVGIVRSVSLLPRSSSELKTPAIHLELLEGYRDKKNKIVDVHPGEIVCVSSSGTSNLHVEERENKSGDEVTHQQPNGKKLLPCQKLDSFTQERRRSDRTASSPLSDSEQHRIPAELQHPRSTVSDIKPPVLEIGSLVEVKAKNNAIVYGVIRWIGKLPTGEECYAGIELDYEMKECTDGIFKGERYFRCAKNKGMFIPLAECKPDGRFLPSSLREGSNTTSYPPGAPTDRKTEGEYRTVAMLNISTSGTVAKDEDHVEDVPPVSESEALQRMEGRMKGIQGHYNSCYLDSALFSLFSFSPVLDSILHLPLKHEEKVQEILKKEIVNPLRKTGFVSAESVMKLRQSLGSESFTSEEKDPEEFLTLLLHQVLAVEPLIKLRSDSKIQEGYSYQIIVDQDKALKAPTVQQLLERSFVACDLKFEEIPSCLIIQMPRFGKKYKMFPKIVPSLELDITDLLYNTPRECFICGGLADVECSQCVMDPCLMPGKNKQFCRICEKQVHSHRKRRDHESQQLVFPADIPATAPIPRHKLELFAVLCIQTSHYVSFVKYGPGRNSWLFFDSMADRLGGESGRNIPEIKACPQVGDYLTMSEDELACTDLKQMDEFAKRLFSDMYMCMYQCPALCLYR